MMEPLMAPPDECLVQYDFVPRTPPTSVSVAATGSASWTPPSSPVGACSAEYSVAPSPSSFATSRSPPELQTQRSRHNPVRVISSCIPLTIQVRKWRILTIATLLVLSLVFLVAALQRGVVIATASARVDGEKAILRQADDLNFYFGTGASVLAKPFEVIAAVVFPIVVLIFLTEDTMLNDSFWWVIGISLVQGCCISLLTNSFSTTYVAPTKTVSRRFMVKEDLFQAPSTATIPNGSWLDGNVPIRMSADTMLRTAMLSAYARPAKPQCMNGKRTKAMEASFGFHTNPWLSQLGGSGMQLSKSFNISMSEWLKRVEKKIDDELEFPFSITLGANLVIHSLYLLADRLDIPMFSGSNGSQLEEFTKRAQVSNARSDNPAFVNAVFGVLNSSLVPMAEYGFFFSAEQSSVRFASINVSETLAFNSITLTLPFKPRSIQRQLEVTQFDSLRDIQTFDTVTGGLDDADGNTVYQVWPKSECGIRGCWLSKPSQSHEDSSLWRFRPEVVVHSRCSKTLDSIGTDLDYTTCVEEDILDNSIVIGAMSTSLHADSIVDFETNGFAPQSARVHRANITNLRRTMSVTLGFMTWRVVDLSSLTFAKCLVDGDSQCEGLAIQLDDGGVVFIDRQHIMADQLSPIGSGIRSGQPLVSIVTDMDDGVFLPLRNIKERRLANRNQSWSCSRDVEAIADSIELNHWYMEDTLQEAYTAGLFHVFQFGVNHSTRASDRDRAPWTAVELLGSIEHYEFHAKIPSKSAVISLITAVLFLASVGVVVCVSHRRECTIRDAADVHRVARVHLVDQFFPKMFLKCTVFDTPNGQPFAPFRIIAMKLHRSTPTGDVYVTLPSHESWGTFISRPQTTINSEPLLLPMIRNCSVQSDSIEVAI